MDNNLQASGQKLTDKELAIIHLALCEERDINTTDRYIREYGEQFDGWLASEHGGDCTHVPITCMRCVAEDALKMAPIYRHVFKLSVRYE